MAIRVDKAQCFFLTNLTVDLQGLGRSLGEYFRIEVDVGGGLVLMGLRPDSPAAFSLVKGEVSTIPTAIGLRGPMATRWKRSLRNRYAHCLPLRIPAIAEALAQMIDLMLAQEAIERVTRGLMINGWNREEVQWSGK